jgi:cytochrome c oxidase subunit II
MEITKLFNLPIVASSHGHEVDMIIYLVHIVMLILFVGWGVFFIFVLFRFRKKRNPQADYTGTKSHVSQAIEIGVVIVEAILLVGFSIPFWAKQVNAFPNRTDIIEVRVKGEQFAWNIHYPGPDGIFGNTDLEFFDKQSNPMGLDPKDPKGKDDFTTINQLHLPIGRPAIIHLTSRDVMHSFSLPVMRVKQDVIPGMSIPTWFTPTKTGAFEIACAQLCGLGHYRMRGYLTIHNQEGFYQWVEEQVAALGADEEGTDDFWE